MNAADNQGLLVLSLLLVAAVVFGVLPLLAARLWAVWYAPPKPGPVKQATYECGLESKGDAWIRFRSEYYLYAIVFLVFDVEVVFLLPFAVAVSGLSWGALVAILVFLLLLLEGWAWAWQKGILQWNR